ncbi:MAG: hypothetical protein GY710_17730 [Desulfobacteraceae bacterium]|nr:hypothetical protein [Desulfobacteraceae bacterium]
MKIRQFKQSIQTIIVLSFILFAGSVSGYTEDIARDDQKSSAIKLIAQEVKSAVKDISSMEMQELMKVHLRQLRLIDDQDNWQAPELEEIADFLLPDDLNPEIVAAFIDQMADLAVENTYLNNFVNQAINNDFENLSYKIETEGRQMYPSVVAYAFVLERLTKAERNDWRIAEKCVAIWEEQRKEANVSENMELFDFAKLVSVEYPVKKIIEFYKSGEVEENFCRVMMSANVMEATLVDLKLRHRDNAKAGFTLAVNPPGGRACKEVEGICESRWSDDQDAVLVTMPLSIPWINLYVTWNMAFTSRYEHFPFVIAKLLIPQVAGYQTKPDEFVHDRAFSLFTHLNWALLGRAEGTESVQYDVKWHDESFTKFWGEVNRESALSYEDQLAEAMGKDMTWKEKLQELPETFRSKFKKLFMFFR